MDTVAIELLPENAHLFYRELEYALKVTDYRTIPNEWNGYYLVVDEDGPFLLAPPAFDKKYKFATPIRNGKLQLVFVR